MLRLPRVLALLGVFACGTMRHPIPRRLRARRATPAPIISGENPKDRLRRIGEILAEQRVAGTLPDDVLLQEAFDKEDRLIDRTGFAEVIAGPQAGGSSSSGLYSLTDHAVLGRDSEAFEACAAEDCLSEKGVLAITSQPDEMPEPIVVITTHLQAQSENDATRIEQIDELVPYLERQGVASGASIFAGDFNFKARPDDDAHPSYRHFLDSTPYVPAGKQCLDDAALRSIDLGPDGNTDEANIWLSTNDHQFYFAAEASAPPAWVVLFAAGMGHHIRCIRLVRTVLALLATATNCTALEDPNVELSSAAIVVGQVSEHASVVAITTRGVPYCTGTLIAPRVVLTAAHCVDVYFGNPPTGGGDGGNGGGGYCKTSQSVNGQSKVIECNRSGGVYDCTCSRNGSVVSTCTTQNSGACSQPGNGNCCGF